MKLGMDEIKNGIYYAAIQKLTNQLTHDGFFIKNNMKEKNVRFDLYAEKGLDKRIYEFKLGKNRIQEKQFLLLQKYAQNIGAKLYIIYLEIPKSKQIEFHNIEQVLLNDLQENTPSSLLNLATHVYLQNVHSIDISSFIIDGDIIRLEGDGILIVEAQYGSNRDLNEGFGSIENLDFGFTFRIKLDHYRKKVLDAYYKVDTSYFYE